MTNQEKLQYIKSRCLNPIDSEFENRGKFILDGTYIPSGMSSEHYQNCLNVIKEAETLEKQKQQYSNVNYDTKFVNSTGTTGNAYTYTYPNIGDNPQNYSEYCFNRLPCGLCRITDKMCPMVSNGAPTVTWAVNCNIKNDKN